MTLRDDAELNRSVANAATLSVEPYAPSRYRHVYLVLGWFFVAVGAAGALLPLVPTTPFILLAAWAFSRSSRRFELWLLEHRWFGPSIQRWRAHRVVPLKAKLMSWSTMIGMFTLSAISGRVPWWALALQALLMGYGAWFVARLPSRVPVSAEPPP